MSATIIMFPARAGDLGPAVCMDIHTVKPGPFPSQFSPMSPSALGPVSCMDSQTTTDSAPISATALATKFTDHFLPICQASIDLLEADQAEFEARCRRMLDADGTAMIDDLRGELQTVGRQMQILVDGLELTRARLRTAIARLADERLQETN